MTQAPMPFILAYIDPATGAILLQIILAGILTVSKGVRRVVLAPFTWFRRGSDTPTPAEADPAPAAEPESEAPAVGP